MTALGMFTTSPGLKGTLLPNSFWPPRGKPSRLVPEERFPRAAVEAPKVRGHDIEVGEDWFEGRLSACSREYHDGRLYLRAAANARGMQGYAVGR